ncbi:MAG: outer membrane protein assembly factor BamA [Pseudomonadales bacterium]|jgi:outer membrane protein insertion porin family|nr:outer membrane protein assembly factor BamA [Pseudomonadales bacterium]
MIQKFVKRALPLCIAASLGLPATSLLAQPAAQVAQQSFTIADIRLEGLQRVAASSVFGLLNVRVGDRIDQAGISQLIRDVFASDYFSDIEVLTEDNVLIVRVQERPTISAINLKGNKLIPSEALLDNMKKAGLETGQVYKPSTLEGMRLALEEQYVAQGMYGASVELDVEDQERNRVALNINIKEGEAAKIVHINLVGNKVFDDDALLKLFELRSTHFTSFFRKDDRYAREKINGDLERLKSFYMDQGYINFSVTSTQVSVSPSKEQVYITINVNEGEVYKVRNVELAGDLVDSEDLLRQVLQVKSGQTFSQQLVTTTSDFMTQLLGNRGYFFAEVEGVPAVNEVDKTVDVTFFVIPNNRTYVNRISFAGNTNTVDEVMRRELRQMEGAPASKAALEQSKVRMERLGYFAKVDYATTPVPGSSDQINVDFTVEEQLSGSIGGSLGYGQVQGLILSANLQMANFLGTGKSVGLNANTSSFSTNYSFSYYDPYYTVDGVSRGYSAVYSKNDYAALGLASYSTNQVSLSTSYGYQLDENQSLSFNFGYNNTKIATNDFINPVKEIRTSPRLYSGVDYYVLQPARVVSTFVADGFTFYPISDAVLAPISDLPYSAFNHEQGFLDREGDQFNNFTLNISWLKSTLNRGLFPTAGGAQSLSLEVTIPGSDLNYWRLRYYKEQFFPLAGEWVIRGRMDLGYGDGYGKTSQLPFFQNFYAGGQGSVRGFKPNRLGPRSTYGENYLVADNSGTDFATRFVKDANGNIVLDANDFPVPDPTAPIAYYLKQAVDADGKGVVDATGLPVYEQELRRSGTNTSIRPAPFGGNVQATGTVELLFPLPFIQDRSRVRSSVFLDAGNVFSSYCTEAQAASNNCYKFSFNQLRYSAGVGISWQSGAFGIMSFSLAKAFNASTIDEKEVFQFNLGSNF